MSNERGSILYTTGRYEQASKEYRATLAQEPGNALAHAMLGLCLLKENAYADATEEAKRAIEIRPDWAFGYATLASILHEREHLNEAVVAIEHAVSLDPFNPANLAILAGIRISQRNWSEALAAADRGLEVDPEHAECLNARGIALVRMGRRDEASETIQGALARNPHNATTHANQGWAMLHSGDYRGAMEHFREALRMNPDMDWAKAGIVEAMKARNPVYRLMLRYFLFMSRLSSQMRWGIVLGGWFGYQMLAQYKQSNPAIAPYVLPVTIAYVGFVLMSWLAAPAANLMLRLNRFGRYALSRDQTIASNWFGGCLALAIVLAILTFAAHRDGLLMAALLTGLMTIPITSTFSCPTGWPRQVMAVYSAALAALVMWFAMFNYTNQNDRIIGPAGITLFGLLNFIVIGFLLSSFMANALMMTRVRK